MTLDTIACHARSGLTRFRERPPRILNLGNAGSSGDANKLSQTGRIHVCQRQRPSRQQAEGSRELGELSRARVIPSEFKYNKGTEIYGEAEPADYVYQVADGAVRSHKLLSDGRRQIGAFHLVGDIFGLGERCNPPVYR